MITLDPEQSLAANWIAEMKGTCILGDEMGLGKTYSAVAGVYRVGRWPILCVVANPVKHVWFNHFQAWDPSLSIRILDGRDAEPLGFPADVTVVNYAIVDAWKQHLVGVPWGQILFDEAHKCGGHATGTFKACRAICDAARPDGTGILLITGTPYTNRTTDIWKLFALMAPDVFPSREKFERVYDAENFAKQKCLVGAFVRRMTRQDAMREFSKLRASGQIMKTTPEQLDELRKKVDPFLLRRVTSASWKPVPEVDSDHVINLTEDEILEIDPELREEDWLKGRRRTIDFDNGSLVHALAVIAEAKAPYCADWIRGWTQAHPTEKIVVAYKHKAMRKAIYNAVRPICVTFDGDLKSKARAEKLFQTEDWARVALVHVSASTVGLTLCAARHMYFAEKPWHRSDYNQGRARINRRGQTADECRYINCTAVGTLDEIVDHIIRAKATLIKRLLV